MKLILLTFLLSTQTAFARNCPAPWQGAQDDCLVREMAIETSSGWTGARWEVRAEIRSGYLPENPDVPFRGNVIYYEGLGDSMLNHMPLFAKLSAAGFRVIAFDYMGQGGSGGSMNDTRIYAIAKMGDAIWATHARDLAQFPKRNIIGWSTGGLAAYAQAQMKTDVDNGVDNVVLIAPGIVANAIVGEQDIWQFKINQITLSSLTSATDLSAHVDPIKPASPLEVMDFAWNLLSTARTTRQFPVNPRVNGLVLLSGEQDNYVDARETYRILKREATQFTIRRFPTARHEIDNEAEPIRGQAQDEILEFLNRWN